MGCRTAAVLFAVTILTGCGGDAAPSTPPESRVTLNGMFPPNGSTIAVPQPNTQFGFILPGSGLLGFDLTVTSARLATMTRLVVFLLSSTGVSPTCGQNLPNMPYWDRFEAGQTERLTISGFQIFRLPCDVTGIRVFLTFRTLSGGFPTPDETLAEGTFPVSYRLVPTTNPFPLMIQEPPLPVDPAPVPRQ